jgi:heterodisulfide reductase subunit A-like polyferredoxin
MSGNGRGETENIVGAVMVVGGGIAGMQAALDLAESGYKVYLVEQKSAIGGHMAQLDKTFPTNDCAMCTISPKLVETGRHLNVVILTDSEVAGLRGAAGNFTATVRTRPRYIDVAKCTGCGECAQVCPVVIPGRFDEGLAQQRAAHKLYPQAIPNAYAIEKRGISPCRDACPAHQRAQGYIALIREGRFDDALRVIKEDNPFPGICGRICNHRCEDACNRGKVDDPINIHALKRFVTDTVYAQPRVPREPIPKQYDERVAIIGSGPCGLTAAQDLAKQGYPVTVFEALPVAGGMLRVGVPEYRLPSWIVDREVQDIVDVGVELRLNTPVTNLDDLFAEGFSAVLIAVGAHEGVRLPIPGANLEGVHINTHFLRDVRLGRYEPNGDGSIGTPDGQPFGKHVLVLGGGNVAIDVARSAVRLGCKVSMACLEGRETMPAHPWEVAAALEEGITIYDSRAFERVHGDEHGRVTGMECTRVSSFSFDDMGRLSVEKASGSNHVIPCDTVIFSVGQRAGLAFIPPDAGVGLTPQRTIAINPNTYAATRPGVFAAGDSVSGTAFVIEAVASGHKCAESIHRYLRGEALEPKPRPELPVVKLTQAELGDRMRRGEVRITPRVPVPELTVEQRLGSFAEVATGYTAELAQAEAARCLACGICSECLSCWYKCGVGAVDHDMVERTREINVGAVILAPGYQVYRAELSEEFGWGRYPNVVTALQFERLLSASGPTMGHVKRPSDGRKPQKIAFLQCIGSRDQTHDYCSAVCCMYATKQAIMAIEHERDTEVHVFMMDMRAFSKGYEAYYRRAMSQYGIQFTRCRVSAIKENPTNGKLIVRYVDESGIRDQGLGGNPQSPIPNTLIEDEFDLVVLSVGMEMSEGVRDLGRRLGVELDGYGFCHTVQFDPLQTSKPGIYAVGPFREPKDIPETVVEASGAAALAAGLLAQARGTLVTPPVYPPERDVSGEEPRIGVFVCHCGSNIGGFLDVPAVAEYAATLPCVVHAEHNLYTCSQDSIQRITEKAKELGLNRVVVASCTPRTHEPLFQDSIRQAGLNPYLFEMANIRNQCSWVHSDNWDVATEKAKDLVRMAVARAARLGSLYKQELPVQQSALVIGGGVAGMTAALALSAQGFPVDLVERRGQLGGNLRQLHYALDDVKPGIGYSVLGIDHNTQYPISNTHEYLHNLIRRVESHPLITVHLNTEVVESGGFTGNFTSTLRTVGQTRKVSAPPWPGEARENPSGPGQTTIRHGVTIVATGGQEYRGKEYLYGQDKRVLTGQEFEALLVDWETGKLVDRDSYDQLPIYQPTNLPNTFAFILCVGPAEKYCGRICCTTALKNAIKVKELNPAARVTILYKDIRTFGFKERLYTHARELGILFMRYDDAHRPQVTTIGELSSAPSTNLPTSQSTNLQIRAWEPAFGEWITLHPDLLVLSTPMVPATGARELGTVLKVPVDLNGWFLEAHPKLRPVDFASDGIYMAGAAHYPKFIDEAIAQAQAAAARAATILSHATMAVGGVVAQVKSELCVGCLTCVRACPYDVPAINPTLFGVGHIVGAAYINPAVCHGCGICAAECPARAIKLMHYTDEQVEIKVEALFGLEKLEREVPFTLGGDRRLMADGKV